MRRILFAASLFGFGLIQASAPVRADDVDRLAPWRGAMEAVPAKTAASGKTAAGSVAKRAVAKSARIADARRSASRRMASRRGPARGVSLAGVYAPLASKAREIASGCGSAVVSGVRHTRVAGTRRLSQHASGRAVDMQGNPSCIYAHLRGWPGGYTTDYGRVRHVHISLGGSEDGLRFAHGGRHRAKVAQASGSGARKIRIARR